MAQPRLKRWVMQRQRELEDRLHQPGEAVASANGWTVTRTAGLFEFGGRAYRDPRFDHWKRSTPVRGPCTKRLWRHPKPADGTLA